VGRLHRGDDPELVQARQVVGVHHLQVLDAQAAILPGLTASAAAKASRVARLPASPMAWTATCHPPVTPSMVARRVSAAGSVTHSPRWPGSSL
jgi:hypothetical protein